MTLPSHRQIEPVLQQQINQLTVSGDILPALDLLRTIAAYEAIATNLSHRYSNITQKASRGLIIEETAEVAINNIAAAIFDLLSEKEPSLPQTLASLLPSLPPNYIEREEFPAIENALLHQTERYYGITGMDGTGKTSLAVAIAHSKKIQLAFEGAIFWVGIGERTQQKFTDSSPIPYQEQLYLQLGGDLTSLPEFKTWQHGLVELQKIAREKFNDKKCLIIVDDVHATDQLLEAADIHNNAIFLVITSDESRLRAKGIKTAATFRIGGMNKEQALQLLSSWSETNNDHAIEANEIVTKLGFHPLATVMAGASIKGSIDADTAWSDVLEAIKECALEEFSLASEGDLHSLFKLSIERLSEEEQKQYYDLSIFPEGWQFELDKLFLIWNDQSERKIRRFIQNLVDKALLKQVNEDRFSLYNLPRLYMRTQLKDALPVLNRVLPLLMPTKPILTIATAWDDESMVETLLKNKNVDINEENSEGLIALLVASVKGNGNIVQLLLKHGAAIDQKNINGKTALIAAAEFGHRHIVDILIKNGADINAGDFYKFTALHNAAELGYTDIVRLLLAKGATPNITDSMGLSPMYHAASIGHTEIILELLRYRPLSDYITHPQVTPLSMAAGNSHIPAMKALLDAGENINFASPADNTTLLHYIALGGLTAAAEFLIKSGAALNPKDVHQSTPLHFAAEKGNVDIIKLLLAAGADVNSGDEHLLTPLHYAIRANQLSSIAALIEGGANVNACSSIDMTPLHTAAGNLNHEMVQLLLNANAEINTITTDGYTPLHTALYYRGNRYLNSVASVEADKPSADGNDAYSDGLPVIELLLNNGASTDLQVNTGHSAIHLTIWHADVESTKLLIEAGASLQVKAPDGKMISEFIAGIMNQPLLPPLKKRFEIISQMLDKLISPA
jgi:ankyrin repeat protein